MPRMARTKSTTGFYHVMLRGIGKQNLFEDDKDRERFLETIIRFKNELNFEIHSYCLMSNHVHLLIKDTDDKLDIIMKKIEGSYVYYFNWKYERVGYLFQDRFKSEPIEDDTYFLTVLRYIHQNPVKAKIMGINEYKWSSYFEYIESGKMVTTDFALDMLGGKGKFIEFMNENEESTCLEITENVRLTDENAIEIIKKTSKLENVQAMKELSAVKRDTLLIILKNEGLSIRQISRLTGINRDVVLKA